GEKGPEAKRSSAHDVGEEAEQHRRECRQRGAGKRAPAKHHHHHDQGQDERRIRRKAPGDRGCYHCKEHRENGLHRAHCCVCASTDAVPSDPPTVCLTVSTGATSLGTIGGGGDAMVSVCAGAGGGAAATAGVCAAVGDGAAATAGVASGAADKARGSGRTGGSVVVKVGVSKKSTLTASSELSSAWGLTL